MKYSNSLRFKLLSLYSIFYATIVALSALFVVLTVKSAFEDREGKMVDYSSYLLDNQKKNLNLMFTELEILSKYYMEFDNFGSITDLYIKNVNYIEDFVITDGSDKEKVYYSYKKNNLNEILRYFENKNAINEDIYNKKNIVMQKSVIDGKYHIIFTKSENNKRFSLVVNIGEDVLIGDNQFRETDLAFNVIVTDKEGFLLFNSESDADKMSQEERNFRNYPPIKDTMNGKFGLLKYKIDGRYYRAYSDVNAITEWIIAVQIPAESINSGVIKLIFPILIILIITLSFLVFLGIVFYKAVLKPLGLLNDIILKFGENDYKPVEYEGKDEIGGVIKSFNEMVNDRDRLEREVLEISENERKRIGLDLHDDLGQHLTGISFQLMLLDRDNCPEKREIIEELKDLVSSAINKTKNIAKGLTLVNLAENGLIPSIRELTQNIEKNSNVSFEIVYDEDIIINDAVVNVNLFHIAQEAINNSVKYSGCSTISIILIKEGDKIRFEISDDGSGILGERKGLGLKTMKYRARILNAELDIVSEKEKGTKVVARFTNNNEAKKNCT